MKNKKTGKGSSVVPVLGAAAGATLLHARASVPVDAAVIKLPAKNKSDTQQVVSDLSRFGDRTFGYVTSIDVSHLLAYYRDPLQRVHYHDACYLLAADRPSARLVNWLVGVRPPICSDQELLPSLLATIINPFDRVLVLGGSPERVRMLAQTHGLANIQYPHPSVGSRHDVQSVESSVDFIERASPFRYCFLSVGSPQREDIAYQLQVRGIARGLALCMQIE